MNSVHEEFSQEWPRNVKEAVERKQRLKAVFFPGQVGLGKLTMDELSQHLCCPV